MAKDSVFNATSVLRTVTGIDVADFDLHINVVGGGNIDGPSAGLGDLSRALLGGDQDAAAARRRGNRRAFDPRQGSRRRRHRRKALRRASSRHALRARPQRECARGRRRTGGARRRSGYRASRKCCDDLAAPPPPLASPPKQCATTLAHFIRVISSLCTSDPQGVHRRPRRTARSSLMTVQPLHFVDRPHSAEQSRGRDGGDRLGAGRPRDVGRRRRDRSSERLLRARPRDDLRRALRSLRARRAARQDLPSPKSCAAATCSSASAGSRTSAR